MGFPAHRLLLVALLACVGGCIEGPPTTPSTPTDATTPDLSEPDLGTADSGPSCDDERQNGTETDVDCGGECDPCGLVEGCETTDDCAEGLCIDGTCALATCQDELLDGDETDVDCGGPACPKCADGDVCVNSTDCSSGVCADGVCAAAACDDGVANGDETDVDCGGGCDPCTFGSACSVAGDCRTQICEGEVCRPLGSCRELLDLDPSLPDGMYTIDTDAGGPLPEVEVYCDMTTNGGAAYTMVRVEDDGLNGELTQQPYRDVCAELGMEVIVPRTRAHAMSIRDYNNGQPANLVNVYPEVDAATGLSNFEGRCDGEPCDYWLNDRETSFCDGSFQPDGDSSMEEALFLYDGISDRCPFGVWNDRGDEVLVDGWVICSTNDDAGPPIFESCLGIADDGAQVNRQFGSGGVYTVDPPDHDPIDVICEFQTDGGGYSFLKVDYGEQASAPEAETYCAERGMQLLVPRSRNHRFLSHAVAVQSAVGPSGSEAYVRILGVYPDSAGARCDYRPFHSGNAECEWSASDEGPFYVHESNGFYEPDGTEGAVNDSLVYSWSFDGGLTGILDEPSNWATSQLFMCHFGDKLP